MRISGTMSPQSSPDDRGKDLPTLRRVVFAPAISSTTVALSICNAACAAGRLEESDPILPAPYGMAKLGTRLSCASRRFRVRILDCLCRIFRGYGAIRAMLSPAGCVLLVAHPSHLPAEGISTTSTPTPRGFIRLAESSVTGSSISARRARRAGGCDILRSHFPQMRSEEVASDILSKHRKLILPLSGRCRLVPAMIWSALFRRSLSRERPVGGCWSALPRGKV